MSLPLSLHWAEQGGIVPQACSRRCTPFGMQVNLLRGLEPRAGSARALPLPSPAQGRGALAPGCPAGRARGDRRALPAAWA